MRVTSEHVQQAARGEIEEGVALVLDHVRRRHLDQRARLDELCEAKLEVHAQMALGMGDQRPVPALPEVFDGFGDRFVEGAGRRLEQDPEPAAAERERGEVLVGEAVDGWRRHLAAAGRPGRDPRPFEFAVERGHPRSQFVDEDVVVVADVRSGADQLDAVALGDPGHRHAVGRIKGPVVDAGEQVGVQVDHRQASLGAAAGKTAGSSPRAPKGRRSRPCR